MQNNLYLGGLNTGMATFGGGSRGGGGRDFCWGGTFFCHIWSKKKQNKENRLAEETEAWEGPGGWLEVVRGEGEASPMPPSVVVVVGVLVCLVSAKCLS